MNFKKFNLNNIKGLSKKQLDTHYRLYKGYVNKTNQLFALQQNDKIYNTTNSSCSDIRSLKSEESYVLNAAKLHELYFENLNNKNNLLYGRIAALIIRDFLSYKRFIDQFKNIGLSMRGWVVLAIDNNDNKLHLYGSDSHDIGSIWNAYPLLVMDVYEHAYMIDFNTDRSKYIDIFIKNIDWDIVNYRVSNYFKLQTLNTNMRKFTYPFF